MNLLFFNCHIGFDGGHCDAIFLYPLSLGIRKAVDSLASLPTAARKHVLRGLASLHRAKVFGFGSKSIPCHPIDSKK